MKVHVREAIKKLIIGQLNTALKRNGYENAQVIDVSDDFELADVLCPGGTHVTVKTEQLIEETPHATEERKPPVNAGVNAKEVERVRLRRVANQKS